MTDIIKISRQLSYILRHDNKGLNMSKDGYILVSDILDKLNISMEKLDYIVENNDKKRFGYNSDKSKIRALQGHTIKVDVGLKKTVPPHYLYAGTSQENYKKIIKSGGLDKMKRLYVHLTDNIETAKDVGKRHDRKKEPVVLKIDSLKMYFDGFIFYLSDNNVWLTDNVPFKYISKI